MTRPRKVSRSIQEALRVILPDDGCFPQHQPGGREMFEAFLSTGKPQSLLESSINQAPSQLLLYYSYLRMLGERNTSSWSIIRSVNVIMWHFLSLSLLFTLHSEVRGQGLVAAQQS